MRRVMEKVAVCLMTGAFCLYCAESRNKKKFLMQKRETDKFYDDYQLLSHWMEIKNKGRSLVEYFRLKGYRNIAIYGMGELANRLCEELEGTDVCVKYGIDREVAGTISRMDQIFSPDDSLELVDAVIVTPFYAMDSIRDTLRKKINCPIVSLEEVVWSL